MSVHSHILRSYLDILNEGPPPGIGPNAPIPPGPAPDRPGYTKTIIPDGPQKGWTRYQKIGSKSRAEYEKAMADFKANNTVSPADLNKPKVEVQGRVPGQDFTVSNLEILKTLVDPQAIARFKKQEQEFGQAPMSQDEVTKNLLPMITHFDDPQGTAKIALNTGMSPEEVLKFIPKDFSLSPAQPAAQTPSTPIPSPTQESTNIKSKKLVEYIEQIELEGDVHPGDGFEIEISEDTVIETTVLESWEDSILIALDNEAIKMLKESSVELITEAEYQGRSVPLGKPMKGDVKKSKVYVRKPNGKVVKVNFGDKKLSIKKHIPGRRKNFRARHNCDNPGPRWKARYWSCRAW